MLLKFSTNNGGQKMSLSMSLSMSVSMDTDMERDMDVDVDTGRFLQLNIHGFIMVSLIFKR
jgi:hypothetical protein